MHRAPEAAAQMIWQHGVHARRRQVRWPPGMSRPKKGKSPASFDTGGFHEAFPLPPPLASILVVEGVVDLGDQIVDMHCRDTLAGSTSSTLEQRLDRLQFRPGEGGQVRIARAGLPERSM